MLTQHWIHMVRGTSYWHLPQPMGARFRPGQLHGYFNDLRGKAGYKGLTDKAGFPLLTAANGKTYYHPTCLLQKALGHWDLSLEDNDDAKGHRAEAFRIGRKIADFQDENGGWRFDLMLSTPLESPYSAMTQGQALSLYSRLYQASGDERFLQGAQKALSLILKPVVEGGTHRVVENGVVLEEFATDPPNAILNGWVFALFGLYDYLLIKEDHAARALLDRARQKLIAMLPVFIGVWWSYYDAQRNLSSPFYQRLHSAQLQALSIAFDELEFPTYFKKLERQADNRFSTVLAFAIKASQKLLRPTPIMR